MTGGLRAILALIIPSAVGMLLLAKPAVALLLGNGHSTPSETATTGAALAMFALGLPGLLHLPLPRPGAPVDAADQGRLLPLPGGERAQHRRWPSCWSTRSASAASPCPSRSPTPSPRCWPWPSSTSGSGAWPSPRPGRRSGASSWPRSRWASSCWWCPTSRGRPAPPALLARVVGAVVAGGLTFGAVVVWLGRRHDARRGRPPRAPPGPDRPRDGPPVRPLGPLADPLGSPRGL